MTPSTDQLAGVVDLAVTSTPGRTLQWPARRSSPNQATTRVTLSTFGRHRLQPVERHHHVGGVWPRVQVLGLRRAADRLADRLRGIGELAGGRDHGDGAVSPRRFGIGERAEHLEGELRHAVAEGRERQLLEDDIGGAAIGGRVGRAHLRGDERIGCLGLVARIPAPGDAGEVHRLAVGPDAADAGDRALAERDGEAGVVEVLGRLDLAAPAALAAALRGGLRLLAEIGRPDDVAADAHAAVEPRDRPRPRWPR